MLHPTHLALAMWLSIGLVASAQNASREYVTQTDILYRPKSTDAYARERCRIDLYYPKDTADFATVVWFHGGGLKGGQKQVPAELKQQGIAVAAVNYRLSPKVKSPVYVEDAAASVAWVLRNIHQMGGDPRQVFVSGHSAGGYLTSMVGLDPRWLRAHNVSPDRLAGLIPLSGHTITHFTVRAERNIPQEQPVVDDMAPLFHVRADAPPILLVTGDRELEMLGRYEENALLWRMLKHVGHPQVSLNELQGFNHGQMRPAGLRLVLKFVKAHRAQPAKP